MTIDSGYEQESQTFELKQKMTTKMRKKSHKSKVSKKNIDDKLKRRNDKVDDKKKYKENDFELISPIHTLKSNEN
jgi:hypothetical protein